jgi:Ca-activated chloride channel family protein
VIALARPQWDREVRIVDTLGQDIVFVIDVSKSMDATDIAPSRIERAKAQINLFLDELRGDRVAIVAFAGNATIICPLTTDYSALKLMISNLSTDTISNFGTCIASGLQVANDVFDTDATSKTIILLTDGEEHEEEALDMARQLAAQSVTIYTLGIGTPEGSPIAIRNQHGQIEYAKDNRGNVIITQVNILLLHRIAEISGGQFFMVSPTYSEIYEILKQIDTNERTKYSTKEYFRYKEQYHIFLILVVLLIVIESLVNYRNRRIA